MPRECSCGVMIDFKKTSHGKFMPVEVGSVAVVTKDGTVVNGSIVHFGRCPDSDEYRKGKEDENDTAKDGKGIQGKTSQESKNKDQA